METERTGRIPILVLFICMLLTTGLTPAVADGEPAIEEGTIHERIAGMSDEEVRKSLIAKMQEESSATKSPVTDQAPGPGATLGTFLDILARQSDDTLTELGKLVGNIPESIQDLYKVFLSLSPYGTPAGALRNIFWVLFFISIGFLAEKAVSLFLTKKKYNFSSGNLANLPGSGTGMTISEKFAAVLITILPYLLGLVVFFITVRQLLHFYLDRFALP